MTDEPPPSPNLTNKRHAFSVAGYVINKPACVNNTSRHALSALRNTFTYEVRAKSKVIKLIS